MYFIPSQSLTASESESEEELALRRRKNKTRKNKGGNKSKSNKSTSTSTETEDSIYVNPPQELVDAYVRHQYLDEEEGDEAECQKILQQIKEFDLLRFRDRIYYGPDDEQRTCIWSTGAFSWKEKTSGFTWIGVTGTNSTCIVSMSGDTVPHVENTCRSQLSLGIVMSLSLADMGVMADTSTRFTGFRRRMAKRSKAGGPFAVVSVAPGTVAGGNLKRDPHEATRAIKFLEEKLKGCSSLSGKQTAEIAVYALKYMYGPKLNPKNIKAKTCGVDQVADIYELFAAMDLTTL